MFARVILSALLVFSLFPLGRIASAQAVDDSQKRALEQDIGRYNELLESRNDEIDSIEAALGSTAAELTAQIAERDRVNEELRDLRSQQGQLEEDVGQLEVRRDETESRIEVLTGQLDELKGRIRGLLNNLYRQRAAGFASGLARSRSFHELQVHNYYLALLSRQDVEVVTELDRLLGDLKAAQQELANQLAALQQKQIELASNAAQQETKRAQLETLIANLEATRNGQLAQKQSLLEEQNKLEASLTGLRGQLEAEIDRLRQAEAKARSEAEQYAQDREQQLAFQQQADAAQARLDTLTTPEALATGFVMPLEQGRVVSRFGEGNNSYIAIEATVANAAVRAVQAGTVVAISYLGANFGYMVAVQHGNGLTTVYTNLREPVVKLFDPVAGGEVLGYLGGGTLSSRLLPFYARTEASTGRAVFVDPAPLLGQ